MPSVNYTPSLLEQPIIGLMKNVPEGTTKERIRSILFELFGAPKVHKRAQIPRKPLLIGQGDSVVLVGTPNIRRVEQLQSYVGPAGDVLIIEPLPSNYHQLSEVASEFDNVIIENKAASNSSEKMEVSVVDDQVVPADHYGTKSSDGEVIDIETETLDTIISNHGLDPDYIEIMVNGAEYDVLQGATSTLRDSRPRLLIKSFGYNTTEYDEERDKSIISVLNEIGYRISRAPARKNPPAPGSPDGDIFAW